jgi:hypothetical protein
LQNGEKCSILNKGGIEDGSAAGMENVTGQWSGEVRQAAKDWPRIEGDIGTGITAARANAAITNPSYAANIWERSNNCQRTVPAWEMRMRGFDVVAKPAIPVGDDVIDNWQNIFEGAKWEVCSRNDVNDIDAYMKAWGTGSRAEIYVEWQDIDGVRWGHVLASVIDGEQVYYVDPQNGNTHALDWFRDKDVTNILVARIDNLNPSNYILDCVEVVK